KMGRDLDVNAHVKIAEAVTLNIFYAFAFNPEHCAGLGARRNLDRGLAVQSRHADFGAEGGLDKINGDFAQEIVGFTLENLVRLDVENNVQITRGTATRAGLAVAAGSKARAGIHAGG